MKEFIMACVVAIVLAVYLVFAMTLYLLPPRA